MANEYMALGGLCISLSTCRLSWPHTWQALAFDTLHALGNVAFAVLFGPSFYHILLRYRKKLEVTSVIEQCKDGLYLDASSTERKLGN